MKVMSGNGMRRKVFSLFVIAMFVFEIFAFASALDSEEYDPYVDSYAEDTIDYSNSDEDYYDCYDEDGYGYWAGETELWSCSTCNADGSWAYCAQGGDYCLEDGTGTCEYYDNGYDYICTIDADYSEYGVCPEENIIGGTDAYECIDDGFGYGEWSDYLCEDEDDSDTYEDSYDLDCYNDEEYYWNNQEYCDWVFEYDLYVPALNDDEVLDEVGDTGVCYDDEGYMYFVDEGWGLCEDFVSPAYTCKDYGNGYIDWSDYLCEDDVDSGIESIEEEILNEGCFYEEKNYAVDDVWYDLPCSDESEHTWTCVGDDYWVDNNECSYIEETTAETCTNDGENWVGENNKCMQCIGGEAREVANTLCVKSCENDAGCTETGTICDNNHCLPGCREGQEIIYEGDVVGSGDSCRQCIVGEVVPLDSSECSEEPAVEEFGGFRQSCLSDKTCNDGLECDVLNLCDYPSGYDCRASGCLDGGECNYETGTCEMARQSNSNTKNTPPSLLDGECVDNYNNNKIDNGGTTSDGCYR